MKLLNIKIDYSNGAAPDGRSTIAKAVIKPDKATTGNPKPQRREEKEDIFHDSSLGTKSTRNFVG